MSRRRPRSERDMGRVYTTVAEHAAATRADVRAATGQDREIRPTPSWQVPISAILTAIVSPHLATLEDPNSDEELAVLASLARMAWNMSRLVNGPDTRAADKATASWRSLGSVDARFRRIADAMLAQARSMHPEDTRLIVRTDIVVKDGEAFIYASSTPGATGDEAAGDRRR